MRQFQHKDDDISNLLKLQSDRSEKPVKTEISAFTSQYKILCVQWSVLEVHVGFLYRKFVPQSSKEVPVLQYIVPESLRRQMFELLHSSRISGHFGLHRTLGSICRRFYWPGYKGL